jgi:hypothetical protein
MINDIRVSPHTWSTVAGDLSTPQLIGFPFHVIFARLPSPYSTLFVAKERRIGTKIGQEQGGGKIKERQEREK